jgi:hypothetical protein
VNINAEHVAIAVGLVALGYIWGKRAKAREATGAAANEDPIAEMGKWWGYTGTWGQ